MNQLNTPRLLKVFALMLVFSTLLNFGSKAQTTFAITKPFIATNQVCINSSNNYNNDLNYAFSSNVTNSFGNVASHSIEISNDNGLITPRIISSAYPNLNIIYVGGLAIGGQNLPFGSGYRIRIITSTPAVFSAFSDPFSIVEGPNTPILNQSGNVIFCTGTSQTLTVTNPNNAYAYQWRNNSANITNETSINYSTNLSGNFSVRATHSNGCSVTSSSTYLSQSGSMNVSMTAQGSNYEFGNPLFLTSEQGFNLNVSINGGKSPYNFTLTDGTTNTVETNVNSSKSYSFIAPVSGSKTYTLSTLMDACESQLNNSANIKVRINNSRYCSTSRNGSFGVNNFSVQGTTINNLNSGRATDGWAEYLNPTNINANVNYNFSITPITTTTQQYFSIWTDLNQNGIFDSGEKIFPLGNSNPQSITTTFTGVLKLPSTSFNGQTRMRVLLGSSSSSSQYPCDLGSIGETEDYLLNIFNGISPTVVVTDSLPKTGVCFGQMLPVTFNISGMQPSINTSYKVEISYNSDFSSPTIIGTGQSSPINCNINMLNFYNPLGFFLRVLPVNTIPNNVIIPSPNRLKLKIAPTVNFGSLIGSRTNQATSFINTKSLSVEPSVPINIVAKITGTPPFSAELSDGRIFTSNSQTDNIVIETNKLLESDTKFKLVRITDNSCSVSVSDSLTIYVGTPNIKINKVQRNYYNDTTSITKLCGRFAVIFSTTHLDTVYCKNYAVQLSDQNGSFANPTIIGYNCVDVFSSESGELRLIDCNIPNNLPNSNGYKLRIVKLLTNISSLVYATDFEIVNPTTDIGFNLDKTVINEGESAALNVNFSGGTGPYTINLISYNVGSQTFTAPLNSNNLVINLSPLNSEKYTLSYSSACYYYSGTQNTYLNVRTLDQSNGQRYIQPFQFSSYYEILKGTYLISGMDTLFKRPYNISNQIINHYFDYNSPLLLKPASVLRVGQNYSLAQISSLNYGSSNLLTGVWADINQDGDFEDAGEELAKNDFSQSWSVSQTQNFTIPNNSNIGFSRLRVRVAIRNDSQPFTFNPSDPLEKNADTYDIPIVILSNAVSSIISTPNISGNTLCNGNTFSVEYAKYGIPTGTNSTVELSDASGNFPANPTVIGQGSSATIDATLPMNITAGNYNIRVVSNGVTSPVSHPFNVTTNQLISMVNGDWHAGSTWSCGRVPTFVDATTVAGGTTVTVFSGDARVGSIITNGVLSFLNGTTLRFRTP